MRGQRAAVFYQEEGGGFLQLPGARRNPQIACLSHDAAIFEDFPFADVWAGRGQRSKQINRTAALLPPDGGPDDALFAIALVSGTVADFIRGLGRVENLAFAAAPNPDRLGVLQAGQISAAGCFDRADPGHIFGGEEIQFLDVIPDCALFSPLGSGLGSSTASVPWDRRSRCSASRFWLHSAPMGP